MRWRGSRRHRWCNTRPRTIESGETRTFRCVFSNQSGHLDSDCGAVPSSGPFDFMIPPVVVSSRSYLAWHVAQNVRACVSVSLGEWESESVCSSLFLTTLRPQPAVSAVNVWLGSGLSFTASNLSSVLLFLHSFPLSDPSHPSAPRPALFFVCYVLCFSPLFIQ